MSIKIIQTKKTTLAYGINDSTTSMRLTNLLKLDGTSMAASDIGDELQGTFAPGTSREEIFLIDGANVVVNADGTIDISSVLRGRKGESPYGSGGFATDHGAGEIVIFGNNPQLYDKLAFKANDETIDGEYTFTQLPRSDGGNATDGDQLITYAQALAMATGTTAINRVVVAGNAGTTVVAGETLYLDAVDNEWKKTDADTAATVNNVVKGIAQGAGTDGNPIVSGVLLFGLDSNQIGLTPGAVQYFGNTAGDLSETPGTVEVTAGQAHSATQVIFFPSFNQQLTEDQQDALAGNNGTPSATNKYVTQTGLQINGEIFGVSAAGTDTYAITLSPVPVAYVQGMRLSFKADVANTGAATLNVNGLGAIDIQTIQGNALTTNEIVANQIVEVEYNTTGPSFRMLSQSALAVVATVYKNGTDTKDASDASTTQNIAHGLGKIPKKIRIRAITFAAALTYRPVEAVTVYNGSTQSSVSIYIQQAGGISILSTTFTLNLTQSGSADTQTGTVTFDATNIIITWTKTNSPTGTYTLLWEAEG